MNYYALLSILTFFFCVLVGTHAFAQDPNRQLSRLFLVITLLEAYLALTEYGLRMAQDFETALFWFKFGFLWPFPAACALHFALVLSRQTRLYHSIWVMISLYLPAVLFSLLHLMPNHFYGLPTRAYWGWAYRNQAVTTSIIADLGLLWAYIIVVLGLTLGIRHFLRVKSYRAKQRVKFILLGFLMVYLMESISETILPGFGIESPELASLGILFGNLFIGYGIWKFKLFTFTPEAAALEIVSTLADTLLVMETSGRVVYANASAEGLFKRKENQLRGRFLSSVLVTEDKVSILNEILLGKTDARDRLHEFETTIIIQGQKSIPVAISAFNLSKKKAGLFGHVIIIRDVRARKQAEKALLESETKFRTLVETTNDWIWETNQNHVYSYASPMVKNMLGYEPFEIIDKSPIDFLSATEIEKNTTSFGDIINLRREFFDYVSIKAHKEGHDVVVESRGIPIFENDGSFKGFRGISRDITQRRAFEKGRLQTWHMLQLVMDNIPQSIFWKDRDGAFLGCNQNFADDAGVGGPADLIGKTDYDLPWKKEEADFFTATDKRVMDADISELNIIEPQHQADGKQALLETNKIPLHDSEGQVIGLLGTYEDITERKRLEEEAKHKDRQLIQADKMISLGVLVSGVAHEINNPNQFIISHIAPLKKAWEGAIPILDSYQQEQGDFRISGMNYSIFKEKFPSIFDNISEGAKRIQNIVDELREYVPEFPGQQSESIHFNSVIQSSLTLINNLISKSTQHFSVAYGDNLPPLIGHYQRLEQVVINLIQNACQALSNDTESISVATYYDKEKHTINLEVKDEGIGISKEQLPWLTDPFYTTKRDSGGLGLGLSISSSIVIEHGGQLKFIPNRNKGTLVRLSLPVPE